MRTQIVAVASALAASVAAHPTVPEITARDTVPNVKLPALSFAYKVGIVDWLSPYTPGPNGYTRVIATWDVFADTGYISGLPGFAVACGGAYNSNNALAGNWTLCSGFPGSATIEGQYTSVGASIRHNVTQNGKTTVVIATGDGGATSTQFELTVQSVETVG